MVGPPTSIGSTASASSTASWITWRTRSAPGGVRGGFGIYSVTPPRRGSSTMSRTLMAAENLDAAIGIGGIPRGRVTEIFGPESSGKTTLALHVVANSQRQGGAAAYIDAEHALDVEYAKKLGVDIDNLLVSQPDTGEQGLEI